MRDRLELHYRTVVEPQFQREHGKSPETGEMIEDVLQRNLYYRVYSALRYNAQKMMFLSVIAPIERRIHEFADYARDIAVRTPAGGTLILDPELKIPRYVTGLDVHLVPGGFHTEYIANDVAQGAIVSFGGGVSTGANKHRSGDIGGVGRSIGYWISKKFPEFRPTSILDLGTQSGKNLRPYLDIFPELEAHGVDVCAPTLRYGHAKAEGLGQKIHFSQQNAEKLNFPDGKFDLIVSSFFFHEVPVSATRRILAECYRMLAPEGLMVHMELPPRSHCDAWQNFYWDWDSKHNNEPHYTRFRSQDLGQLMREAGFSSRKTFTTTIPNLSTSDLKNYAAFLSGETKVPLHGRGGWFVFGAWR